VQLLRQYLPNVRALRDVTTGELAQYGHILPPIVRRRCAHVISENERTLAAVAALRAGEVAELGELMDQSHASLRDDYQVSCQELDTMVDVARRAPGCLGARMTGAGFGGCTVNLVGAEAAAAFAHQVAEHYAQKMGLTPEIYICEASGGAGEL
jgi:galactokinase